MSEPETTRITNRDIESASESGDDIYCPNCHANLLRAKWDEERQRCALCDTGFKEWEERGGYRDGHPQGGAMSETVSETVRVPEDFATGESYSPTRNGWSKIPENPQGMVFFVAERVYRSSAKEPHYAWVIRDREGNRFVIPEYAIQPWLRWKEEGPKK